MEQSPTRGSSVTHRLERCVLRWCGLFLLLVIVVSTGLGGTSTVSAQTVVAEQSTAAPAAPQTPALQSAMPDGQMLDDQVAWVAIVAVAVSVIGLGVIVMLGFVYLRRQPSQGPVHIAGAAPPQGGHNSPSVAVDKLRPEAYLIDAARVTGSESILIDADEVVFGRSRQNIAPGVQAVFIPVRTIGRRHAAVQYRNHAYYLIDKGSINGTLLNKSRIHAPTVLHDGDLIGLESVEFKFSLPVERSGERTVMMEAPGDEQDAVTIVLHGDPASSQPKSAPHTPTPLATDLPSPTPLAPTPLAPTPSAPRPAAPEPVAPAQLHQLPPHAEPYVADTTLPINTHHGIDFDLGGDGLQAPVQQPPVPDPEPAIMVAPGFEVAKDSPPPDEDDDTLPPSQEPDAVKFEPPAPEPEAVAWFDLNEKSEDLSSDTVPPVDKAFAAPPASQAPTQAAAGPQAAGGTLPDAPPGSFDRPKPPPPRASTPSFPQPADAAQPNAWLRDLDNVTGETLIQLDEPEVIIGRIGGEKRPNMSYLIIRRTTVGRKHAAVIYVDGRFHVEDFQSINGTLVNDVRVLMRTPINPGDIITFDEFRFKLEVGPDASGGYDERTEISL
ncbi:MAG: FHA domain-containing protein [Gammaproteobacteria bacterium]|nr:FHA domain-containing protein [Gammaproteobacteria bacterium]